MVNDKIINACKNIISKHNDSNTLYELLEAEMADGLTFYEAEIVAHALDYYMAGRRNYFLTTCYEMKDITPYDVVLELREIYK